MSIQPYDARVPAPVATTPPNGGAMRLVEWAAEASAAHQLAVALCKTPFAGQFKGDADAATAAILKGSEVGLTPVTSLGAFDLIQGTPAPKAMTLRALVQSAGHEIIITEATDTRATAKARRAGSSEWQPVTWTIEQATRMGLTNKDNWKKQPKAMLVARVTSEAARLIGSDVILGIGYSSEEMYDEQADRPARRVQRAAVVAPVTPEPEFDKPAAIAAVPDVPEPAADPEPEFTPDEPEPITPAQLKALHASLNKVGLTDRDEALDYYRRVIGHDVDSSKSLTKSEAGQILDDLERCSKGEPNLVDPATANDPELGL